MKATRAGGFFSLLGMVVMAVSLAVPVVSKGVLVTLQGPAVTRDTSLLHNTPNTNYANRELLDVRERYGDTVNTMATLFDFDFTDYIGGLPVEDVQISFYIHRWSQGSGDMAIRPLKLSWVQGDGADVGATWNHRDAPNGDLGWDGGNIRSGYDSTDPASVTETGNFGARLATTAVTGGLDQWFVWQSQELDDYVNAVISGGITHHGWILEMGMAVWGNVNRYWIHASENGADQPMMSFTVIPEPGSVLLLGVGGLLLLARRRYRK